MSSFRKDTFLVLADLDCGKLDVIFALDSSESVENENWIKMRQFTMDLIDSLSLAPEGARVIFKVLDNMRVDFSTL